MRPTTSIVSHTPLLTKLKRHRNFCRKGNTIHLLNAGFAASLRLLAASKGFWSGILHALMLLGINNRFLPSIEAPVCRPEA